MDKAYFIDKLTRAFQMEDEMAGVVIALLEADGMPDGLTPESRDRISAGLREIREDTLRHRQAVQDMIAILSGGKSHG